MSTSKQYILQTTDPFENLACEEWLFETLGADTEVFLVYVNSPCVVIGKNQNPWSETQVEKLRSESIPLLRRITGGGTVWHDLGNVNFSWMGPKVGYTRLRIDRWVGAALQRFSFEFDISPQGDYLYKNRKFSGNAFAYRGGKVLHHGTLLVASDLARLGTYLGGSDFPKSVGTRSRPMVVTNLTDAIPELTVSQTVEALAMASGHPILPLPHEGEWARLVRERSSEEWVLGETPRFYVPGWDGSLHEIRGGKWQGRYYDEKEWHRDKP